MLNKEEMEFLSEQAGLYNDAEKAVVAAQNALGQAQTSHLKLSGGLDMFAEMMRRKYKMPEGTILNSKGEFIDKEGKVIEMKSEAKSG